VALFFFFFFFFFFLLSNIKLTPTPTRTRSPLVSASSHKSYRPLTTLSFRLQAALASSRAAAFFRGGNVILHVAASVIVLITARRITGWHGPSDRYVRFEFLGCWWLLIRMAHMGVANVGIWAFLCADCQAGGCSDLLTDQWSFFYGKKKKTISSVAPLVGALLFAAHPAHCEAVAGVVGRAEILMLILGLGAWLVYTGSGAGSRSGAPSPPGPLRTIGAAALVVSSTLAKESGITIFGVLLATEAVWLAAAWETPRSGMSVRRVARGSAARAAVILAAAAAYMAARHWLTGGVHGPAFALADNNIAFIPQWSQRALTYMYTHAIYAGVLVEWRFACFFFFFAFFFFC
jgi:hypothetical protein